MNVYICNQKKDMYKYNWYLKNIIHVFTLQEIKFNTGKKHIYDDFGIFLRLYSDVC
jgi:hypothetical protein